MNILYLCDGRACKRCGAECEHTTDITHAKNFELALDGATMVESGNYLRGAIKAVSDMYSKSGVPQSVYVIEECSELIKELTKKERGKRNSLNIIDEACDVLTTVFVLLNQYGVSENDVQNQILFKCNRALERFIETGEV